MTATPLPAAFPTKQPRGLPLLFFTEMWERFSYYGMRALLILYLIDTATGGFGWTQEKASRLYGWYTGLAFLIADPRRLAGRPLPRHGEITRHRWHHHLARPLHHGGR